MTRLIISIFKAGNIHSMITLYAFLFYNYKHNLYKKLNNIIWYSGVKYFPEMLLAKRFNF